MSEFTGPGRHRPTVAASHAHKPLSRWYPFVGIPTPRLLTYNVRSYSSIPISEGARIRHRKILTNLQSVMKHADIVLVQETKIQNKAYYRPFRRDWFVFHNPYPTYNIDSSSGASSDTHNSTDIDIDTDDDTNTNAGTAADIDSSCTPTICPGSSNEDKQAKDRSRAGTDIFVRKTFAYNFNIDHVVDHAGYIHHLSFSPCASINASHPYFSKTFTVFNVYVPTDGKSAKQLAFSDLQHAKVSADYIFAGGDWNTIPDSTYTVKGTTTSSPILRSLQAALTVHNLKEVVHPAMTRISGHSPPKVAKLDRWYVSHTEGDRDMADPEVWFPPHPFEPGMGNSPSDHFPLLLCSSSSQEHNANRRIPLWLASKPCFANLVAERWKELGPTVGGNPFDELQALDKLMHACARTLVKEGKMRTHSRVEAISLGVAVYRDILGGKTSFQDAHARCKKNTVLEAHTTGSSNLDSLAQDIGKLVVPELRLPHQDPTFVQMRSTFSTNAHSYTPCVPKRGDEFNKQVHATLGNSKTKLSHLVDKGDRIEDPDQMARALGSVWGKVWRGDPAPMAAISRYLRTYTKRIAFAPGPPTLEEVIAVVTRPRGTCPGPNGVPFLCYSVLCDIAAPILHKVILHLMKGGAPVNSFNVCDMFFLPKDGTHRPDKMRPIAASNTSNRIVANVVRWKLEASIHPMLSTNQAGFVRGKTIEENIEFYNDKFYTALYTRHSPAFPAPGNRYREEGGQWAPDNPGPTVIRWTTTSSFWTSPRPSTVSRGTIS